MQILIFIVLKVAEISAIIFVPYWIGLLIKKTDSFLDDDPILIVWIIGLAALLLTTMAIVGIVTLCRVNWEWASSF